MCLPLLAPLGAALAPAATAGSQAVIGSLLASQMAVGAYSAFAGADAAKSSAEYQSGVADRNAALALQARDDAVARGTQEVQAHQRRVGQMRADQITGAIARGVDPNAGSTLNLLDATEYFGMVDARRIQESSNRQAWGHDVEALNYRNESRFQDSVAGQQRPLLQAGLSLIGGAGNVADKWLYAQR